MTANDRVASWYCDISSQGRGRPDSLSIFRSVLQPHELPLLFAAEEVTHAFGRQTAPDGIAVYNPAFDVTPAELIAAIITDRGVIRPVNVASVRARMP